MTQIINTCPQYLLISSQIINNTHVVFGGHNGSYSLLWSNATQFVEADSLLLTTELKSLYDDKILLLLQIFTFQSGNIDYIRRPRIL